MSQCLEAYALPQRYENTSFYAFTFENTRWEGEILIPAWFSFNVLNIYFYMFYYIKINML